MDFLKDKQNFEEEKNLAIQRLLDLLQPDSSCLITSCSLDKETNFQGAILDALFKG